MMRRDCAKQALQASSLATLVEHRLRTVPLLRSAIELDPSFTLRIGAPRSHDRDTHGRNWDIVAFQTAFVHWPQSQREFRVIVNELRAEYDLA